MRMKTVNPLMEQIEYPKVSGWKIQSHGNRTVYEKTIGPSNKNSVYVEFTENAGKLNFNVEVKGCRLVSGQISNYDPSLAESGITDSLNELDNCIDTMGDFPTDISWGDAILTARGDSYFIDTLKRVESTVTARARVAFKRAAGSMRGQLKIS